MSGYSKNGRTTVGKAAVDWYKVLQISPSSTPNEIKTAYYKIAQMAHPDKHNGCSKKLEQFKRINEAYDILSNPTKRNEYDQQMGHYYHHHHSGTKGSQQPRRHPVPKDYRKVYTSRPPPEWKMVWDHTKHYEMHYGDGFQKEAMKQAIRTAEQDGTFIYHSVLGKGFTFQHLHDRSSSASMNGSTSANTKQHGATTNSSNHNPYSKNPVQGPPKIIFDYQEIEHNYGGGGGDGGPSAGSQGKNRRQSVLKHERIVYDLHLRRFERYREEVWNESQQKQQQQKSTTTQQQNSDGTASGTKQSSPVTSAGTRSSIYSRYDWRYQQEQQQRQQLQESLFSSLTAFSSFLSGTAVWNGNHNDQNFIKTASLDDMDKPKKNELDTSAYNIRQQQLKGMKDTKAENSSCTIM
jgi:curved DNA-binding protein CbpA